ncbi:Fc receptor-like protein 1 isoform X2 [Cricetulus griseus]|uniref:Fc receptor-like protein 1 isoform X2 n=1 Tax=Cricetulus griseus TaxID=10029 RepID=A0A9J7H9K1_CRIGR|nr:Fc receptor-like protein 1 isoform X2 [Cricetulus griseus]XP_035312086.1 Fc receptor-like protein 1 isoform X2 [Cricetulus griseus]
MLPWLLLWICESSSLSCVPSGIPVSDVSLETRPPGGWVTEGNTLVLICSVANATGNITYLWYRGTLGSNLETKIQHSLTAEFEIIKMKESDAGQYYCAADNGYGPILSDLVSVTVIVPVSRPVLTFGDSGTQSVMGDLLELHCEALRGSPPIFYQFYHENVILGNSSAPSGGGASFRLPLTAELSGNYSCEANNGQGAHRSEVVTLNLTGRQSDDPLRSPPRPVLQESNYINSPDPRQLQSVYENVNVVSGDEIYSLVYHTQQEVEPAATQHMRTHGTSEVSRVFSEIYSKPRKINTAYMDYEDTM